jgi:uncharacterized membrane protein YkvA (DUF1232 family)
VPIRIAVGVLLGIVLLWAALVSVLWRARPEAGGLAQAMRVLPDLLRMLPRLARDGSLPRGVRVRLWLLLAYLAVPIDLIPDFIPVLGYADDAIIIAVVLRSVIRRSGPEALSRHWSGTPDGLLAVQRLAGLGASAR